MSTTTSSRDPLTSTLYDDLRDVVQLTGSAAAVALPACGSGTLLRALLLVHGVIGLGLMFSIRGLGQWLLALSEAAMVAMPATLAWLLLACLLRRPLARWPSSAQMLAGSTLAASITLGVWWPMVRSGLLNAAEVPLAAPGLSAALLAAVLQQSERWRQRARLPVAAAARLADLQTRIRPHFLFNTLNTAIALVQINPRLAEEVLEDLSELFRAALGALDAPTNVEAELALAQRYIAIEQLRFGKRMTVVWQLDPSASAARLPPLVLQPLIENAVRHGVEPSDRGGRIEVRTSRRRDRVLISVTNTMPLGPSKPGHGIGLASVRERLRLMHDLDADFRSGVIEDGRWRVSLGVPAA